MLTGLISIFTFKIFLRLQIEQSDNSKRKLLQKKRQT